MSLLTCGLNAFAHTPAPLSEPLCVPISVLGPAHLSSPGVGLTLQSPDLAPTTLSGTAQW